MIEMKACTEVSMNFTTSYILLW